MYHHVSRGHLNRYGDELAFRYADRKGERRAGMRMLVAKAERTRFTYKQPTNQRGSRGAMETRVADRSKSNVPHRHARLDRRAAVRADGVSVRAA
jgi:hypothetical protein